MIIATHPKQYIHVTGFAIETVKDGIVPLLLALDSYSIFVLKMEASKELTDDVFVKFIQDVVDENDLLKTAEPVTLVIDTAYGTEEKLLKLIGRDIKLLCDSNWNEMQFQKVMPDLKKVMKLGSMRYGKPN